MSEPMPLHSNREIENAAVAFVLQWEANCSRPARDTRGTGAAADVAGAVRVIEVKAYGQSARGQDLWLEPDLLRDGAVMAKLAVGDREGVLVGAVGDLALKHFRRGVTERPGAVKGGHGRSRAVEV